MDEELARLQKLAAVLKYELPAFVIIILMYIGNILAILITAAVILIVPFLTKIFVQEKKYGWLISYYLFIILPFILGFINIIDMKIMAYLNYLSLLSFIIYFFLLKLVIDNWIEEKKAKLNRTYLNSRTHF